MVDKKASARMGQLRKFISNAQEAELVKDMIADGLKNEQILQALGFTEEANRMAHPDAHGLSNKILTDEEEQQILQAQRNGGDPQPGQPGQPDAGSEGGDVGGDEEGDEGDPMQHVIGLLTHMTRKNSKNKPQRGAQGTKAAKPLA